MFKFALFLVVAFCAVQGFEARTVQYDDRSLEDVINALNNIIQKIKDAITNSANLIPEIIQNVRDKIKEIIENFNLPSIIAKIKEEIEQIIALGEAGKKCVEAEREQIDGLLQNAQAGAEVCTASAQTESAAINEQLNAVVDKANEVLQYMTGRIVKCLQDNPQNPIALRNCLEDILGSVTAELEKLQVLIETTIAKVKEIAQQVPANLVTCVEKVRDETVARKDVIISSIEECIAGSV
ncbi:hypothetical protein CBL_02935 [Carabus blaptoides fortunei]